MVSNDPTQAKRILFSPGFEEHPEEYDAGNGIARVKYEVIHFTPIQ